MKELQRLVDAETSDLFDVLEYIAYNVDPITRETRVSHGSHKILEPLTLEQKIFIEFVLFKYVDSGVFELDQTRLPELINLKYQSLDDGLDALGGIEAARNVFIGFQKYLYAKPASST